MQSVFTRYLGPTNHRGGRIKAETVTKRFSVTLPWDFALGQDGNHDLAARTLVEKMNWAGEWYRGSADDDGGNVYVNIRHNAPVFFTAEIPPTPSPETKVSVCAWHSGRGWYWDTAEDSGGYDRLSPRGPYDSKAAAESNAATIFHPAKVVLFAGMPDHYPEDWSAS